MHTAPSLGCEVSASCHSHFTTPRIRVCACEFVREESRVVVEGLG